MLKVSMIFAACFFVSIPAFGEWIEVEKGSQALSVDVVEPEIGKTVIEYRIAGFERDQVEIAGELYDIISLEKESKYLEAGYP